MRARPEATNPENEPPDRSAINPRCVTRWRIVADTESLSALADIIFTAVSSVYVNDRPPPNVNDQQEEAERG
jgi:hypothetical protein